MKKILTPAKMLFGIPVLLAAIAFVSMAWAQGERTPVRDVDGTPLPAGINYRVFVHYPHSDAGKPIPLSVPACTESASTTPNDYLATGWHLSGSRTYQLNEATVPSGVGATSVYSAANTAWSAWNRADSNIVVSQGLPTNASRPKFDGINLLAWNNIPSSAIAVTYTWYDTATGKALESDTIFNRRLGWSYTSYSTDCGGAANTYDVGNIATHEFGHWIGLDDLYGKADKDLTMYGYGFTGELKKDTLGLGDATGAATITP